MTMFLSRLSWIRQSKPLIDFYEKIHHLVVMFWQFRVQEREPLGGKKYLEVLGQKNPDMFYKKGVSTGDWVGLYILVMDLSDHIKW